MHIMCVSIIKQVFTEFILLFLSGVVHEKYLFIIEFLFIFIIVNIYGLFIIRTWDQINQVCFFLGSSGYFCLNSGTPFERRTHLERLLDSLANLGYLSWKATMNSRGLIRGVPLYKFYLFSVYMTTCTRVIWWICCLWNIMLLYIQSCIYTKPKK